MRLIKSQKYFHLISLIIYFMLVSFSVSSNECGKFADNLTSPICTDAKYIFWTGTALAIGIRVVKGSYAKTVQDKAVQKNHLKRFAEFGGDVGFGYLNGAYILGQSLFGGSSGGKRSEHMLEASLYSFGVTYGIKKSVHESRPGFPEDPDSFPSGHSSFSFAFASVVTAQHGWFYGGLAHLAAIFISYSRINDGWHHLHDVVAGMTIGMSYGWGIYYNHKDHSKPYWLGIMPTPDLKGSAVTYNYQF